MNTPRRQQMCVWMAVLGWSGLALQLYLVLLARWETGASVIGGVVAFFSFFTVLTNTLVAVVLTYTGVAVQSKCRRFFLQPWVSSGIAVSIIVVGVAYSLLLRNLWQPQGLQWLANELLHDVMPLVFSLYWWFFVPKGTLRIRHIGLWILYPIAYFAYTLLRGHLMGVYPYPFVDVDKLGYALAVVNALGILAGFIAVAVVLIALDRWRGVRSSAMS